MKRYEAYKPSNLPWVAEIPSGWKISKNSQLFRESSELSEKGEEPLLSLSQYTGISYKSNAAKIGMREADSKIGYRVIHEDDIVMNIMLAWNGSTAVSPFDGIISPAYAVYRQRTALNPKYFHYLFRIPAICSYFESNSTGLIKSRLRLYSDSFMRLFSIFPPREEQDQIVRYLDWQVSKINRLIAAKRKEIALLHEQHKRRISEAVLHGNDDGCCQKDSGVEWIGMIPEHWSVIRCKYVFTERDERSIAGEEEHLSMSQKYGLVPDSKLDERRMLSESYVGGKVCYKNDLVLNRLKAHLGVFALSAQKGVISPDYTVLIPNAERILPTYGEAVLKNDLCRRELRIRVRGIIEGFWRLYTDDFNTIVIPLPPLKEQEQIMKHLSALNNKFTALKQRLEQEINILHELRTRLISDVVTGQVDVRGIKVPDDEYINNEITEEEFEETEEN